MVVRDLNRTQVYLAFCTAESFVPTKGQFWAHDLVSSLFLPEACRGMVREGALQGTLRHFGVTTW